MIEKAKGEKARTPEPFSDEEFQTYLRTPLFQGRKSVNRPNQPGNLRVRDGKWWLFVLLMHTGMRPGEVSQLLAPDFVFEAAIPHVLVRATDDDDRPVATKSVKNTASIRAVPLHPDLLVLGLRQFVERRAARHPNERVFSEFRLGAPGKWTEGVTQFATAHLKAFGLHKPGRAAHVFRHVVVNRLRSAGCPEEAITAVVGHAGKSMTSKYGGEYPLELKLETIRRLSYGLDIVGELGGPYNEQLHRCS